MQIYSAFLLSVCLGAQHFAHAVVVEIAQMNEVHAHVDPNTLLIFDLDNTVYSPAQTLGAEQWFDYLVKSLIDKGEAAPKAVELASKVGARTNGNYSCSD